MNWPTDNQIITRCKIKQIKSDKHMLQDGTIEYFQHKLERKKN